ncbi:MAG: hypothetical protein ABIS67_15920 [Candidatus Eisenbacteria bacterium]
MKCCLLACAVLIALWTAESHAAGLIRGTIWSSRGEARRAELARVERPRGLFGFLGSITRRKAPAHAKAPLPRHQPELRDVVVLLRRIPEEAEHRLARQSERGPSRHPPRIMIQQSRYKPRVTAVVAGTRVEFQNLDRIWHSTFSVSAAERFDLGKLPSGAMGTVTVTRSGAVNLHCDIHPEEAGFLVVAPNHAYARPDSLGHFELPRLPEGRYDLEIWHPLLGVRNRVVVLPSRGDAECDLAF